MIQNNEKLPNESEPVKLDKATARMEVLASLERMYQMGANDYEPGAIGNILRKLTNDEIEPEEAVRQAFRIENSKQDYH